MSLSSSLISKAAARGRFLVNSKRNAGGFLKKNIYVEENAGIRENGYKTFEFNGTNLINMFFFLVLPGTLFTYSVMDEMVIKDQQLGRKREYGLLPKDINNTK